jgi:hydroxymethylbilane synthase
VTTSLRIGTRGSRLALWQANFVAEQLRPFSGDRPVVVTEIQTRGDRARDRPLDEIAGEGVFTKEIQLALLAGSIDVAVHSLKDLPTICTQGLVLAAVPPRGSARDAFVSRRHRGVTDLPLGARVATSSLRRKAQLLYYRRDLCLVPIRGNVETRLRKSEAENLDGLILAEAGLVRLGLGTEITELLSEDWLLPAVGQGALGLECRTDDAVSRSLVEQLNDGPSNLAVTAERSLLQSLGGGCQVPLGAFGQCRDGLLRLRAAVLDPSGHKRVHGEITGTADRAEALGRQLAKELSDKGARELLDARTDQLSS